VVVPAGTHLADDVLLGVCTVADDSRVRPGTSWFGHPAFELPRREVVEVDRRLTHDPSLARVVTRLSWECARFAVPLLPLVVLWRWLDAAVALRAATSPPVFLLAALPGLTLLAVATLCAAVLALKWAWLGRVRPAQHPLWSCWCSRWDFLYVAWGAWARRALANLEGTLLLAPYLRAMGCRIGRRVVLGRGFAQVVDPDMLSLEDGATVDGLFQAHSFEDRVLKIDRVRVRRGATVGSGAVLLYGADVGERTQVSPHSVAMKHERLLPDRRYAGCPTAPRPSMARPCCARCFLGPISIPIANPSNSTRRCSRTRCPTISCWKPSNTSSARWRVSASAARRRRASIMVIS